MGFGLFSVWAQSTYNILDYGAVKGKRTNSQKANQQAIDRWASQGRRDGNKQSIDEHSGQKS